MQYQILADKDTDASASVQIHLQYQLLTDHLPPSFLTCRVWLGHTHFPEGLAGTEGRGSDAEDGPDAPARLLTRVVGPGEAQRLHHQLVLQLALREAVREDCAQHRVGRVGAVLVAHIPVQILRTCRYCAFTGVDIAHMQVRILRIYQCRCCAYAGADIAHMQVQILHIYRCSFCIYWCRYCAYTGADSAHM